MRGRRRSKAGALFAVLPLVVGLHGPAVAAETADGSTGGVAVAAGSMEALHARLVEVNARLQEVTRLRAGARQELLAATEQVVNAERSLKETDSELSALQKKAEALERELADAKAQIQARLRAHPQAKESHEARESAMKKIQDFSQEQRKLQEEQANLRAALQHTRSAETAPGAQANPDAAAK
jgi:chromosome segregation ATPase